MKYEERQKLYAEAVKQWGIDLQGMMVIEESSELIMELLKLLTTLIKRLTKLWRNSEKSDKSYKKSLFLLQDEIADVDIMIEQAKMIFGQSEIERFKNEKLKRLKERLNV